ncbi:MAG: type II CRISPR-associated endonuclease Cas1 [Alphaproteobacteria bacterium]|nr:type II CRISPR-associated endonuclease Cas1 [Alphaproteobacteria bacterium]
MNRIVDVSTDGQHLSAERGHLIVAAAGTEMGRVPLDDIAAVIVHAHGTTYSNNLMVALAERGALLVICAANHSPVAVMSPIAGHHAQTASMILQADAAKPLKKRLWQQIVVLKIRMQAAVLVAFGASSEGFQILTRQVRSGDPDNIEAQAARRYWPRLFGDDFRRDRDAPGENALLNYGYAIMRSICARAIVAAGLNPSLGIHHHNRQNAFALADDLIEPFRPVVDACVAAMVRDGIREVEKEAKQRLTNLVVFDLPGPKGASPVHVCVGRLAQSLARSFSGDSSQLVLPGIPDSLQLASAGRRQE